MFRYIIVLSCIFGCTFTKPQTAPAIKKSISVNYFDSLSHDLELHNSCPVNLSTSDVLVTCNRPIPYNVTAVEFVYEFQMYLCMGVYDSILRVCDLENKPINVTVNSLLASNESVVSKDFCKRLRDRLKFLETNYTQTSEWVSHLKRNLLEATVCERACIPLKNVVNPLCTFIYEATTLFSHIRENKTVTTTKAEESNIAKKSNGNTLPIASTTKHQETGVQNDHVNSAKIGDLAGGTKSLGSPENQIHELSKPLGKEDSKLQGTPDQQNSQPAGKPAQQDSQLPGTPAQQDSQSPGTPGQQDSQPAGKPAQQDSHPAGTPAQQDSHPAGTPAQQDSQPPGTPAQQDSQPPGTPAQQDSQSAGKPAQQVSQPPGTPAQQDNQSPGTPAQQDNQSPGKPAQQDSQPAGKPAQQDSQSPGILGQQDSQPAGKPSQQDSQPAEKPAQQVNQPAEKPVQQVSQPPGTPAQQDSQSPGILGQQDSQPAEKPAQQDSQPAGKPAQQVSQPPGTPDQKDGQPPVKSDQQDGQPPVKSDQQDNQLSETLGNQSIEPPPELTENQNIEPAVEVHGNQDAANLTPIDFEAGDRPAGDTLGRQPVYPDLDGEIPIDDGTLTGEKEGNEIKANTAVLPSSGETPGPQSNGTFVNAEDPHFFVYFLTMVVLCIIGYLAFHNKQKILALTLEGHSRRGSRRRQQNTTKYRKLDSNLEEAVTSSCKQSTTSVIY